jgi:hypothetical protein
MVVFAAAVFLGLACSSDPATTPEVNHPPVWNNIGSWSVRLEDTLRLDVSATDPDGDIPTLSLGASLDNCDFTDHGDGTGLFRFYPHEDQIGTNTMTFVASDAEYADSELIILEVMWPINHRPEIDSIPPQTVPEGQELIIELAASDPDGDSLEWSVDPKLANSVLTDHGDGTAIWEFNPDFTQQGIYLINFTVYDGVNRVGRLVNVIVINVR